MTGELTEADKKILVEAMGQGMGQALKEVTEKSDKQRIDYIERLTRIETKLDVLLQSLKVAL